MQKPFLESKTEDDSKIALTDMSIVLVCWNNKTYLKACLESLFAAGLRSSFDVVVVDNGSGDGSQDMLHDTFPSIPLIQNESNAGLGKASNQGIEATRGRYVLLLNNDTLVNGFSLDAMVNFLDAHPEAGAVGGNLFNPDGSFQTGYSDFSNLYQEFLIATRLGELIYRDGYPLHNSGDVSKPVGWLSSACLLVRRAALDEVGLLDEEYFIYGDETDLQYRLNRAGWLVYYLPSAKTIHYGGISMNRWRRRKMIYRGKIIFYRKNYGPAKTWILRLMLGILSLFKMLIWGITFILPAKREQASQELQSNAAVISLCLRGK